MQADNFFFPLLPSATDIILLLWLTSGTLGLSPTLRASLSLSCSVAGWKHQSRLTNHEQTHNRNNTATMSTCVVSAQLCLQALEYSSNQLKYIMSCIYCTVHAQRILIHSGWLSYTNGHLFFSLGLLSFLLFLPLSLLKGFPLFTN